MRYLILILALCLTASGQPIFGGGKVAAVIGPNGTTLPASCSGRTLFDLTAADGGNAAGIYRCSSGTYVLIGPASAGAGTGDVTGPSASVDGEVAVYDGITGKAIKRFAGTGLGLFTSGVLSVDSGLQFNTSTKSLGVFGPITSGQTSNYLGKFLLNGITSGTVTIQPADAAGTWTLTLPTSGGSNGHVLTTDGSGVTSWADPGAASMVYPGEGVANSTGSAWGTSYTVGTAANNLVQLNGSAQLPAVSAALLTNFPTLNQNTTGTAASLSAAGGTLALSGGNGITLTTTGTTNVTLPTSGTLLATSTTDQGSIDLKEAAASGDNYWRLASPASLSGDRVLELPDAAGTAGQALVVGTPSGGTLPLVWASLATLADPVFTSSVQLPNGTGPTVDAAGEVAVDTTTDQLQFYGAAKRALPSIQHISFVIPAPADTDDINLMKAPYGMTILGIDAIVQGSTSVTGQLQECNSSGASCADLDSDIVADSDGAADDGSLTDSTIASGAWIRWKTTSVSGTPTFLTVTVRFRVVAD